MKRKIIALVLTVIMMVTSTLSIAAATTPEEKLNDMGLLLNITDSELDATLTRDVGITMILKSLGYTQSDADEAAFVTPFDDVTDWAVGWAALAYELGITTGIDEGKFDPKGTLTEKQFVAFQLRALQYDTTSSWDNTVILGRTAGLVDASNNLTDTSYTKREAADVMYNALSATLYGTSTTLVSQLIDKDVIVLSDAEKYGLVSNTFKILNVKADNLKVMTVQFSKAYDTEFVTKDTIVVSKNDLGLSYDDDVKNGVTVYKYAIDKVDDTTINIIFGTPLVQKDIITLELVDFRSEDGELLDDERDIKVTDDTAPFLVEAVALNQKIFTITYSEPVQFKVGSQVFEHVMIDNKRVAATATMSYDATKVTFELVTALSEGDHDLEVETTVDYAGISDDGFEKVITVEEDNEDPYVVDAYAPNRSEAVIEFNEPILDTVGSITISDIEYDLDDDDNVTVHDETVYIDLTTALTPSDAVSGLYASFDDVEDKVGNRETTDTKFFLKAEFDNTVPTVSASVNDLNEILVSFSEEIQSFTALNYALIKTDEDGDESIVPTTVRSSSGSDKLFIITLTDPQIDSVELKLSIKAVRDKSVFENKLADTDIDLTMNDLKQPTVTSVKMVGDHTVRVYFSEEMNKSQLSSASSYMIDDNSEDKYALLKAFEDYEITVDDEGEYVDIELPILESGDQIAVMKVDDASGKVLEDYGNKLTITSPSPFVVSDLTAKLVDDNKIELVASGDHEFDIIHPYDFVVRTSSGDSTTHYVASAVIDDDDASIAYLTLNADLDTDARYEGKRQYLYLEETTITKDIFEQELEIAYSSPLSIDDYVKPYASIDIDTADTLIIEFSEVVNCSGNADIYDDVFLRDKDGNFVDLSADVTLDFTGGNGTSSLFDTLTISGLTGGEEYSLEIISRHLEDDEDNTIVKFDKVTFEVKD